MENGVGSNQGRASLSVRSFLLVKNGDTCGFLCSWLLRPLQIRCHRCHAGWETAVENAHSKT